MAAVTITAVQATNDEILKKTLFSPEYEMQIQSVMVVAIAEYVDPITSNVNGNYCSIYLQGQLIPVVAVGTFAQMQALFPMT